MSQHARRPTQAQACCAAPHVVDRPVVGHGVHVAPVLAAEVHAARAPELRPELLAHLAHLRGELTVSRARGRAVGGTRAARTVGVYTIGAVAPASRRERRACELPVWPREGRYHQGPPRPRTKLLDVVDQDAVEQGLVAVLQARCPAKCACDHGVTRLGGQPREPRFMFCRRGSGSSRM